MFLRYPDNKVAIVFHVIFLLYLIFGIVSLAYRAAARSARKRKISNGKS